MAYQMTTTMTRPNTGVELPRISDSHPAHDVVWRTKFEEAGVNKSYSWSDDELVLTIVAESVDKASYDALIADMATYPDEAACMAAVKSACVAAGVGVVISDSDGTEFANF